MSAESLDSIIEGVRKIRTVDVPNRNELDALRRPGSSYYDKAVQEKWADKPEAHHSFPVGGQNEGPFEITPDLAQVRIVHSVGMKTGAGENMVSVTWASIIDKLNSPEIKQKIIELSPQQALPASVKIVAATVGDNEAYRNMFYVTVFDHAGPAMGKALHTPHMYKDANNTQVVGFPLHLLTEEGGFVLEEPPQLTDTFRHYWYISQSMLTCCAYKQESATGSFIQIPKNSDAARLMWYVLITKNGITSQNNLTGLSNFDAFNDNNDPTCWRFPEFVFKKVRRQAPPPASPACARRPPRPPETSACRR